MNMCTYLVLSSLPICCFPGSRGGGAGKGVVFTRANKKARTIENEIEDEFEQEAEIMPRPTTGRTRGGVPKAQETPSQGNKPGNPSTFGSLMAIRSFVKKTLMHLTGP